MSLADVTETEMVNVDDLLGFIRRTRRWAWDTSWVVVTSVYNAKSATVLTTGTRNSTAVLRAKAELKPGRVKVADLSTGFTFAGGSSIEDKFVCERNFTPLYRGRRVRLRELVLGGGGGGEVSTSTKGRQLDLMISDRIGITDARTLDLTVEDFDPTKD
jgi:hypothetical protein